MTRNGLRVLSIIPPMTQLNTPYPSTAYLTGFLRSRGIDARQEDFAIKLVLRLFSEDGLAALRESMRAIPPKKRSALLHFFDEHFDRYRSAVPHVLRFLQDHDSTLAHRICLRNFLPEGPRFRSLDAYEDNDGDPLAWAFGALGLHDRARHLATLFLNDLADVVREAADSRFEFVRYAESLAASQPTFEPLQSALSAPRGLIDRMLHDLTNESVVLHRPTAVLLSVPFPGNVYAAFRIAQSIKEIDKTIVTVLGGGYVNTELRELKEPRVFDYFDFVTLDAGERPTLALIEHIQGERSESDLVRTFIRDSTTTEVSYRDYKEPDIAFSELGTPTWDGLPLGSYLSLLDMLNPMHRLWSDGRWNKLTIAQGCYWKKCSFCDVTLDYISNYETASASLLVDRIETIVRETGQTGFHFVDEAAPPKALKAVAQELIKRNVSISWWGNIRFEKSFSTDLCRLLAQSGCIAISGGLEVASDRLLKLMKKGVSVEQVARVTRAFTDAGILVHAYLMYGFPTQTVQDTVDALEYVRQLFAENCIQSGFFHRFTCTVHSPVGKNPRDYGITVHPPSGVTFANNDVNFTDSTGVDHDALGIALKKALYNYMHGIALDRDVRTWFTMKVPRTTVAKNFIVKALASEAK